MNHYILIGTFKGTPNHFSEFLAAMEAHHAYLKSYKEKGMLLLSEPKTQGGGGVILIRLDDEDIKCNRIHYCYRFIVISAHKKSSRALFDLLLYVHTILTCRNQVTSTQAYSRHFPCTYHTL